MPKKTIKFRSFFTRLFQKESTLKCEEPFASQGGKYEGLRKIGSLSKIDLQEFLCREVSSSDYRLVKHGGVPGAAFTLPEITWTDANKVMNIGNHQMVKNLISNKKFTTSLDSNLYQILQDLYTGTSPVSILE